MVGSDDIPSNVFHVPNHSIFGHDIPSKIWTLYSSKKRGIYCLEEKFGSIPESEGYFKTTIASAEALHLSGNVTECYCAPVNPGHAIGLCSAKRSYDSFSSKRTLRLCFMPF